MNSQSVSAQYATDDHGEITPKVLFLEEFYFPNTEILFFLG